jgi:type I restriction-modification system DNA methylase subunit
MGALLRKETIGEKLGVSLATVNNWIKTQVIPLPDTGNCYSQVSFDYIIDKLKNTTDRLNSRANRSRQKKKEICYLGITDKDRRKLLETLVYDFEQSNLTVDDGVLALSLSILRSNNLTGMPWRRNANSKIDALLSSWMKKCNNPEFAGQLYSQYKIQNSDDDILGAFYQSLINVSQKSNKGSYYTPSELLKGIKINPNKTVLDPCCGSGSILLNVITKKHDQSKIFARDIDEIALKICFINLALFFHDNNITANISKQDITADNAVFLFSNTPNERFDYIITNPPWGSRFSEKEKKNLIELYPELETSEIFSISLYNSLKKLKNGGELFFFLPHAFLNVAAHKNIRNYVFGKNNKAHIKLLGNAFKGVLSESILLSVKNISDEDRITIQNKTGNTWQLPRKNIVPPDYIVSATSNGTDTALLEKIYGTEYITLKDNVFFALGLVTGNNKKYLLNKKTKNAEAIFRGKDIGKYKFMTPEYFIEFQPDLYQQIAPVEYYRQKKIAYRFICDKLVCVLDNDHALLLNSANLFISKNYQMETIVSFFNSDIYTFIFKKKFHSKKVLKSHLQSLPLPVLSPRTHQYIYELYIKTFTGNSVNTEDFQAEIDKIICKSFSIDKNQYDYIRGEI